MPPTPCMHCGHNFMLTEMSGDKRLCNCCALKANTQKKGSEMGSKTKMLFECDRETQIEIEEYCMNAGKTISEYFMDLHKTNIQPKFLSQTPKEVATVFDELPEELRTQPKKPKGQKKYE